MSNFGQDQRRRRFQPQESRCSGIEYFESRHERDEPDAEIGQISADFERGRFAKVSKGHARIS